MDVGLEPAEEQEKYFKDSATGGCEAAIEVIEVSSFLGGSGGGGNPGGEEPGVGLMVMMISQFLVAIICPTVTKSAVYRSPGEHTRCQEILKVGAPG